ncbi:hypothetical protein CoNPh26_CDS0076 [Staphylococcus phage S-CoN_Ph26]|nr:hypothetical protein CoNPh26_CDS0076 [Staphylococcus phage S-CoN_Ph26]
MNGYSAKLCTCSIKVLSIIRANLLFCLIELSKNYGYC